MILSEEKEITTGMKEDCLQLAGYYTALRDATMEIAIICGNNDNINTPETVEGLSDIVYERKLMLKILNHIDKVLDLTKELRELTAGDTGYSYDELLVSSANIYKDITGKKPLINTDFGNNIMATYSDLLKKGRLTPEKLQVFADKNSYLGKMINENRHNSVYRDAVIIILAWLVSNYRISVPKDWGYDLNYLQEFYANMGISPIGLF